MNKKQLALHITVSLILLILLTAADQIFKHLAVVYLKGSNPLVLIEGVLELNYLENTGAAFGMFKNMQWAFYIITAIVLFAVIFVVIRVFKNLLTLSSDNDKKYLKSGLFLNYTLVILFAGAVGNLIDRIANKYVVDYIYFKLINFPIFNFADICVSVAAVLLIIYFLFIYKSDGKLKIFAIRNKDNL